MAARQPLAPGLRRYRVEAHPPGAARGVWLHVDTLAEYSPSRAVRKVRNLGRIPARLAFAKLRATLITED
jgi:hypothetical protein